MSSWEGEDDQREHGPGSRPGGRRGDGAGDGAGYSPPVLRLTGTPGLQAGSGQAQLLLRLASCFPGRLSVGEGGAFVGVEHAPAAVDEDPASATVEQRTH